MDKYPMTPAGKQMLEDELIKIRTIDRPANIKSIEIALDHGDLKENAEYKYAKNEQSLIAGRLEYVEDRIARSDVIDPSTLSGDRVVFGAKVSLENIDTEEQVTYQIVGEHEANIDKGTISVSSPIARGLISKEVGDKTFIKTPSGIKKYEIFDVEF